MGLKLFYIFCRKDIKDPEKNTVSAKIDVKVPCPVEPTDSIGCYITNTVSISKSRHLVQGQILLPSRRMDITMYPRWSSNKDVFYNVVWGMFSVEDDLRRKASQQDAEDIGNTSFKVKETLEVMLNNAFCPPTNMPLVRTLFIPFNFLCKIICFVQLHGCLGACIFIVK